jgi:hypothetical protein
VITASIRGSVAEWLRNLVAHRWLMVIEFAVLGGAALAVAAESAQSLDHAIEEQVRLDQLGRSVLILEGPEIRPGGWCTALTQLSLVDHAGGVGPTMVGSSELAFSTDLAEPAALTAYDPALTLVGSRWVVVGDVLRRDLGTRVAANGASGAPQVVVWAPPSAAEEFGRRVVKPADAMTPLQRCVVKLVAAPTDRTRESVVGAAAALSGDEVLSRWQAVDEVRRASPLQSWWARPARGVSPWLGMACGMLMAIIWFGRCAGEVAVARLYGEIVQRLPALGVTISLIVGLGLTLPAPLRWAATAPAAVTVLLASQTTWALSSALHTLTPPWKVLRHGD